jgi:hypothetical protein
VPSCWDGNLVSEAGSVALAAARTASFSAASASLACASSLALITKRTDEGEVLESPKDRPQSFAKPKKNKSGVEEKTIEFRFQRGRGICTCFRHCTLDHLLEDGNALTPLPLALERVPAIGETIDTSQHISCSEP